jgi:hypothetical protein
MCIFFSLLPALTSVWHEKWLFSTCGAESAKYWPEGRTSPIFYIPHINLLTLEAVQFSRTYTSWELTFTHTAMYSTSLHFSSSIFQSSFPFNLVYYEQRTIPILRPYLDLHSNDNLNDFFPASAKARGWERGITLSRLPFPHLFTGVGARSEAGWVLPCPLSLPTCGRGQGTRDSPYK